MKSRLSHIAIWSSDIERSRQFYQHYFDGRSNEMYTNQAKGFASYFVDFDGLSIEIMSRVDVTELCDATERVGLAHFAFSVGSRQGVDSLIEQLRADGVNIRSEARTTGDGFYEASITDPDGNIVEIVA